MSSATIGNRVQALFLALDAQVSKLHAPMPHKTLVSALAYETGEGTAFIMAILSPAVMAEHPACRHDGEAFTYAGKPARRWRWHKVDAAETPPATDAPALLRVPATGNACVICGEPSGDDFLCPAHSAEEDDDENVT